MPGGILEQDMASTAGPSSVFVGSKLDEHRGAFVLDYPMEKGHVNEGGWDAMEKIWEVRFFALFHHLETSTFGNSHTNILRLN